MDGRAHRRLLTMGFLTGFLAGALGLPSGERRYIYERGRYDGQLVGRGGLYERTIRGR